MNSNWSSARGAIRSRVTANHALIAPDRRHCVSSTENGRLRDESRYPVRAGDSIWMALRCARRFVAAGKQSASNYDYMDVNRDALAGEVL